MLVSYAAPAQYDIDLLVNDIPGLDPGNSLYYSNLPDAMTGAAPSGNEYVNIRNPAAGTYYVTIINYDEASNAQYTLSAQTNQGGVGGFPSSTIAAQNPPRHHGGSLSWFVLAGLGLAGLARRARLTPSERGV